MHASRKKMRRFWLYELIFCGVVILMFVLMKLVPFLLSIGYAFTDWNGVSGTVNVSGLANFRRMMEDRQFWYSLGLTLRLALVSVVLTNIIAFFLAYFLTKPIRIRNTLRAGFYLPNVIGGLVLGFIWQFIFLKVFPAIGQATGLKVFSLLWLGTPDTAFWGLVIVQVWQYMGYYMLLYIAGFVAIPTDCLESARMDGAGPLRTLGSVIVPLMMSTVTRCLFLSIIASFKTYTVNMALTEGGPFQSSEGIAMNIYRTAFTENSMGYGTAKSLVFTVVVVLVTTLQIIVTSRKEVEL